MEKMIRKMLADGVRLTCVSTQKFKTSIMSASLILPLGGGDTSALACLPYVLRRGTKSLPDLGAIGGALDSLYGARIEASVRKKGESLVVGFVADVIDGVYAADGDDLTEQTAKLLMSFLYDPLLVNRVFSEEYVQNETENLADRILARPNDTRSYAVQRLWELMCNTEAYGCCELGTVEGARAIAPAMLHEVYLEALGDAAIELFYCGGTKPETVARAFADAMDNRADGARPMPITTVYEKPMHQVQTIIEEKRVTQGKLSLGFRTGITSHDPRWSAMLVFNTAFGASTSSKLFLNVREKLSLCYYASSRLDALKGVAAVTSGIDNENFEVARDEILKQLHDVAAGGISDDEIASAKLTLQNQFRAMADQPLALENYWLTKAVAGEDVSPEQMIDAVEAVTRDEVIAAAKLWKLDTIYFLKGVGE